VTAFIRLVTALSRLCGVLAALMVLTSVLVVCQMVVTRYGLRASTTWQTEFVTYLLIAATLIGSPYVLLTRGHVNIDLIPHTVITAEDIGALLCVVVYDHLIG